MVGFFLVGGYYEQIFCACCSHVEQPQFFALQKSRFFGFGVFPTHRLGNDLALIWSAGFCNGQCQKGFVAGAGYVKLGTIARVTRVIGVGEEDDFAL